MPYEAIKYEVRDEVATVTLNRPAARNALDIQMREELAYAVMVMRNDSDLKAAMGEESLLPKAARNKWQKSRPPTPASSSPISCRNRSCCHRVPIWSGGDHVDILLRFVQSVRSMLMQK